MKQSWSQVGLFVLFVFFIFVPQVIAVSLLIDVDPGTVGVQNLRTVSPGDSVSVDVVVTDLTDALQGFEFDLTFNPAVLTPTSVVSGGFLTAPFVMPENDILPPDVNFAEFALGVSTSTGNGILASVMFQATNEGISNLLLNDVILSGVTAPGDVFEISPVTIENGSISVASAPIPEPATVFLLATGLVGLLGVRKIRRSVFPS